MQSAEVNDDRLPVSNSCFSFSCFQVSVGCILHFFECSTAFETIVMLGIRREILSFVGWLVLSLIFHSGYC